MLIPNHDVKFLCAVTQILNLSQFIIFFFILSCFVFSVHPHLKPALLFCLHQYYINILLYQYQPNHWFEVQQPKLLLYRYYVFVLDLFPILWCEPVIGYTERMRSDSKVHVLAVAALDRNLSMVWWLWRISVSQLCYCWYVAVSFWVVSIIVWVCFGVLSWEAMNEH
jgi:hypothetical protein